MGYDLLNAASFLRYPEMCGICNILENFIGHECRSPGICMLRFLSRALVQLI